MDWKGRIQNPNVKKSIGAGQDTGVKEPVPEKQPEIPTEELKKSSPGKDLMERIKKGEILVEENEPAREHDFASFIKDGVEVVDVKAIPKKEKLKLDKFGIPIPENRQTWDRI